ncbi:MAG: hypothetical protein EOO93_05760 [Pedobacter sp.]|nr:MAG: hypothetical protein EOO93_05760 [Pedobacter sp.]
MKVLIFTVFMILSKLVFAQNTITVSGVFKENYRAVRLSNEVNRLLFIKTKGHLKLPEYGNGYFLNLTKEDAARVGFDDILVIPLRSEIYQSDKNLVKLDLVQLSENEPSVFYTKQSKADSEATYGTKIFENPSLKDTVDWNEITQADLLYTKQWIDNLDNEKQVMLKSYILYDTDKGSGSSVQFSKIMMKELAKERLHRVNNLFTGDRREWTKKQWQVWFQKTINYQEPTLKDCNPNQHSISQIYKYNDGNTMIFGTDHSSGKIIGAQMLSYNVDRYQGRQMVVIDSSKDAKYDYYTGLQKQVYNIRAFESVDKNLYFFDYYGNWSFFEFYTVENHYVFKAKKEISIPESAGRRADSYVEQLQTSEKLTYAITKNDKTKEFYALVLKTQTGENLITRSLKDILGNTAINYRKNFELVDLKYGLKSSNDFVFGIKQGDEYYLVKTDEKLENVKCIKTTKALRHSTLFVHDKTIDLLKSDHNNLLKISFDKGLTKQLSEQHKSIENWYYDEDGLVVYDGSNYKLFAPLKLEQHSGIELLTLSSDLEITNKQCVYQFLPLEVPEYTNMMHLQYAAKVNNNWWLLFRQESSLKYVKIN